MDIFKELWSIIFVFVNTPEVISLVCRKWRAIQRDEFSKSENISNLHTDKRYDLFLSNQLCRLKPNSSCSCNIYKTIYSFKRFILNESYDAIENVVLLSRNTDFVKYSLAIHATKLGKLNILTKMFYNDLISIKTIKLIEKVVNESDNEEQTECIAWIRAKLSERYIS